MRLAKRRLGQGLGLGLGLRLWLPDGAFGKEVLVLVDVEVEQLGELGRPAPG